MSTVYLIHFDKPYHHARHYIGCTRLTVAERMRRHDTDRGAKLLRAVRAAGIGYRVVRTWEGGDWDLEKQLKRGKSTGRLYCPICRKERNGHGHG